MQLSLNIYKGREIEKTYTANEFNITMGVLDDLVNAIDIDAISGDSLKNITDISALRLILKCYGQIKPVLKDIFPDVTDDELRRVHINEIAKTAVDIIKHCLSSVDTLSGKN